jgi:hypothetical protein
MTERNRAIIPKGHIEPSCDLNFWRLQPWYDETGKLIGSKVQQVCSVDPCGSFPDWIKTLIVRYLAEPIILVVKWINKRKEKAEKEAKKLNQK